MTDLACSLLMAGLYDPGLSTQCYGHAATMSTVSIRCSPETLTRRKFSPGWVLSFKINRRTRDQLKTSSDGGVSRVLVAKAVTAETLGPHPVGDSHSRIYSH
jgi:hypothetical protein